MNKRRRFQAKHRRAEVQSRQKLASMAGSLGFQLSPVVSTFTWEEIAAAGRDNRPAVAVQRRFDGRRFVNMK